jgi:hypothetical protein
MAVESGPIGPLFCWCEAGNGLATAVIFDGNGIFRTSILARMW